MMDVLSAMVVGTLITGFLTAVGLWIVITLLVWLDPPYGEKPKTLLAILQSQRAWFRSLARRIY